MNDFARRVIASVDWATTREACGRPSTLPEAFEALLTSTTPADAEKAYWGLENHVVVQGQLYSSAVPTVSVILASLCDDSPRHVRISVLELLFQIVAGESHQSEVGSLGEECRERAREGLWLLYKEVLHGESAAARDVIERIEPDERRLATLLGAS